MTEMGWKADVRSGELDGVFLPVIPPCRELDFIADDAQKPHEPEATAQPFNLQRLRVDTHKVEARSSPHGDQNVAVVIER